MLTVGRTASKSCRDEKMRGVNEWQRTMSRRETNDTRFVDVISTFLILIGCVFVSANSQQGTFLLFLFLSFFFYFFFWKYPRKKYPSEANEFECTILIDVPTERARYRDLRDPFMDKEQLRTSSWANLWDSRLSRLDFCCCAKGFLETFERYIVTG